MNPLDHAFIAALNHLLQAAAWARSRLAPFANRGARLVLGPVTLRFTVSDEGYATASDDTPPAVNISLPLEALPGLVGLSDSASGGVRLEGDAEFAEALGFVLRNLRWDAEEDLSRLIGDIAAHRVGEGVRSAARTHSRAWQGLRDNLVEYLVEDGEVLVTRTQLALHVAELVTLRDDLARCEKRIERLERRPLPPRPR